MATLEAQRRARAAHEDRLKARGYVKATLRLSPESVAHLAALKVSTGTPRETLINAAILAFRSPTEAARVAALEAEVAKLRAVLNEDGLCDPGLAAIGGGRMSIVEAAAEAAAGKLRKFTPPVQDNTAGPESAIEQTQAERRSREPPKSSKPPTPPAKPMKGIQKAPERAGVDVPLKGTFTRGPIQKGTKR